MSFLRLLGLLLALSVFAGAQTPTGRISGRVLGPAGSPVAGATVEAEHLETGRSQRVAANDSGVYRFAVLPVGPYEITASAPQFQGQPHRVELAVGAHLNADLRMLVAGRPERIEVRESTHLIEPDNAALGDVIERQRIARLPLNERQFLQLALLAPGSAPAAPGSELSRQNNSGLHINGAREASNNFLLDGVDNNDLFINRLTVSPPLDSVREFRLHSANYHAEYGRSAGAQVNVVTRSGANEFHGSLYEYLRNDAFDARNFFDPGEEPPQFQRNQFGASLGGRIVRNRTFFFGGYEGTRIRDAVTKTARVPSLAERGGDFSASPQPVIDPFTQQPFPDNRVPSGRINPIGAALANRFPAPNRPAQEQNLVSTPRGDTLVNQGYGRVDHYFSPNDTFYVRYNFSHDRSLEPFNDGNTNVPGFGSFTFNRGQNLAISETHVFNPSTIWESRFGFNRLEREVLQQNAGADVAAELGIPGITSDPQLTGFPAVNVSGFDPLSDNIALPIVRTDDTFHVVQSLTHIRGRHTLKAGLEWRRFSVDGLQAFFARGQLNFLGALTTNPMADLLLGLPSFTIQTVIDNPLAQRTQAWNGYIQDDWKVTRNLTLNLGLRYEWNQPAVDANDRFTALDPASGELVRAGTSGVPRAGFEGDTNDFAPRFGVSWSPGDGDDWVLRGGYGIFYDTLILEANSGLFFNPPFFQLRLFFPSQQQLLTLGDPFPEGAGFSPPAAINTVQHEFNTGYIQQWNASVERTLPSRFVLRAAYVGSKGTKLLRRRDINQPRPGPDAQRPNPRFDSISLFESGASSIYHSLQLSLERRLAEGLAFSGAYTWSKSIDDASAFLGTDGEQGFPQNSHNMAAERGLSNFDVRHRFVFSSSYELPFERNPLWRGWRIFAIGTFQGGRPFTPQLSFDNSGTGNTGAVAGADRPDVAGDPERGPSTPERFFNTDAFVTPEPFTFGNAGRNILTGPGLASLDVAVVRRFALSEQTNLNFRAEAFNVANRANFDLPRRISDQPGFGRIFSARAARQLQFSLRLEF